MTPGPVGDQSEQFTSVSALARWDSLSAISANSFLSRQANRLVLLGLALFALVIPHSVAAAHISLNLSLLAWLARDLIARRWHFVRTPLDAPLFCFTALTTLSTIFSEAPERSWPKMKSLLLLGVIYLIATNVNRRGARLLSLLLIVSSLAGVAFSLGEKLYGRGMIVAAIAADSPLLTNQTPLGRLQPGDVIWMIARRRVSSPADAARVIRRHQPGEVLSVEAIHAGDPVPVTLTVTEALQAQDNPLGVTSGGRTRRFRVSGFTRQYLTYAEQMQIFALLCCGFLFAALGVPGKSLHTRRGLFVVTLLFSFFALALVLTASRAVIVSFLFALLAVSPLAGLRRAPLLAAMLAILLGALAFYVVTATRPGEATSFHDDSAARRLSYMRAGLRVIPQYPFLGVGLDAHISHWREWNFPGEFITHTHSTPIQIALDRGLPALFCYFWLLAVLFTLLLRGYRQARARNDRFAAGWLLGAFGAVLGFSLSSLANYNFGDSEVLMLLSAIVGLAVVTADDRQRSD